MVRPRTKKQPIKVLNAVIIDNRKDKDNWFLTFKYDGLRYDMDCNEGQSLFYRCKRVLEISDPDIKEIEMKLWFSEERMILKRTDIFKMYLDLKKMLGMF